MVYRDLRDEVDQMLVHQVGHVFFVAQGNGFAIDQIILGLNLGVPVNTATFVLQIVIKTKIASGQRQLAPFADHGAHITRRL
jgi:hypothetical protein